jgi:hypothetical protein
MRGSRHERQVLAGDLAGPQQRLQGAVRLVRARHDEQPEVSRSSRWTIPARSGCSPPPPAQAGERLRERRAAMARRRVGHNPRRACPPRAGGRRGGRSRRHRGGVRRAGVGPPRSPPPPTALPLREPVVLARRRPSTVTAPASIIRWAAAREGAAPRAARNASRRRPASPGPAVRSSAASLPPLDHVEQGEHAHDDARVGHVEGGHATGSMKSITAPSRARSARFPSAPPSSMPTGSHSHGISRWTRK